MRSLERLARIKALRLSDAERLHTALDREKSGLEDDALASRLMLSSDKAPCAPPDLVIRRILSIDRRLAVLESGLVRARQRLMAEKRGLQLLEKALRAERLHHNAAMDAIELAAVIDRIVEEPDRYPASLP